MIGILWKSCYNISKQKYIILIITNHELTVLTNNNNYKSICFTGNSLSNQ